MENCSTFCGLLLMMKKKRKKKGELNEYFYGWFTQLVRRASMVALKYTSETYLSE